MNLARVDESEANPDTRPLSRLQIQALLLCSLVAMLDGNDTQLIGLGAPSIAAHLQVAPSAMGWAISGSWLGAAGGALVFGRLADRFGRKAMLIAATLLFSLFTFLTPYAETLPTLTAYRVLTGIGLGGATPCFIALASECAPERFRGSIVSIVWAAFPLGLLLGGLFNGWLLAQFHWQMIFYVGGALPLVLAMVLIFLLPESPSFLSLRRQSPQRALPSGPVGGEAGMRRLVGEGRLRPTLCIWVMLFTCFGTTASMSWIPTILRQHGVPLSTAAVAASFLGLGALLGMALAGWLVDRFGAAKGLVAPMIVGAAATAMMGIWPGSPIAASILIALVGAFVGLGASGGIALIAFVYPNDIRSTGAGWAMAMGRFGQVAMPGIFAVLMGVGWNADMMFLMLGAVPLLGAIAAAFVQRKPPPDHQVTRFNPASISSTRASG